MDFTDEETIIDAAKALGPEGRLDVLVNCGDGYPYSLPEKKFDMADRNKGSIPNRDTGMEARQRS